MSVYDDTLKGLAGVIKSSTPPKTQAYDTPATVRRVENGVAYVHIEGGVDETPVSLSIDAKPGDTVMLRVSGGRGWIIGNSTAPPTDNTRADEAMRKAKEAGGTATKFVTDTDDGIFVHPKNNDADGVRITDAIEILKGGLSFFRAWVEGGLAKVRVGKADAGHTNIDSNGMRVYGGDGTEQLANIGYGEGNDAGGNIATAPYYELGIRTNGAEVGNYSMLSGKDNEASGMCATAGGVGNVASEYCSHAGGQRCTADGIRSFAHGLGLEVTGNASAAVGMYNRDDQDCLFMVGAGEDDTSRDNALGVHRNGNITLLGGALPVMVENVTVSVSFAAGTIGTRGAAVSCGSNVKSGYTFIGAFVLDHQNTTTFNTVVVRNANTNSVNLLAYRATGNAVTDASVTVRKVWLNSHLFGT